MALPGLRDPGATTFGNSNVTGGGSAAGDLRYAPPRDPLKGVTPTGAGVVYRDIPSLSYTLSWGPDSIAGALASHAQGDFAQAAGLIEALFGDDRIQATLGSRTGALFGQKVIHQRGVNDADGSVEAAWQAAWPLLTGQGSCYELKRWAIMNGFAVAELLWDTSLPVWQPYFKQWNPLYLQWNDSRRCLVATTQSGPVDVTPGNGKWFVHAPYGLYRGWLHASVRALAGVWLQKQKARRDWSRYNERHGLPIIKAYVPAAGDARQKANFVNSMATLGQEAVVGLPQNVDETGYDLELLEATDRSWQSFQGTIADCDRSMVLTIKSQNLTTEVDEGSLAAARQHGSTEQVTLEFDNGTFAQDLYEQVARPFAFFNFGDPDAATRSSWDVTPLEDYKTKSASFMAFAQSVLYLRNAGVAVDAISMASDMGIELHGASPCDPLTVEVAQAQSAAHAAAAAQQPAKVPA